MKKILIIPYMKRFIMTFIFCFSLAMLSCSAVELQSIVLDVRDYDEVSLPAGTFVGVESAQEISTQYCPNGYKASFITTNDYYVDDVNIIPTNTTFIGYVDELHDPIVGTNGSFKVKVTKMILPDGYEMDVKGYIYTSNNNMIGGEMSEPAEWRKMPHYQKNIGMNTTLQIRPGRIRKMGSHALIHSGEDLLVVLIEPLNITHTLTN